MDNSRLENEKKHIILNYGISDHVMRSPGLVADVSAERLIRIPLSKQIPEITGFYSADDYAAYQNPNKLPQTSRDFMELVISQDHNCHSDGGRIYLKYIPEIGMWIAIVQDFCLEDHGEDDTYHGPYLPDKFLFELIQRSSPQDPRLPLSSQWNPHYLPKK